MNLEDKEYFFNNTPIKDFIKVGVLKEVCSNDKFAVFNFCNQCYIYLPYLYREATNKYTNEHVFVPSGYYIKPELIDSLMQNSEQYYESFLKNYNTLQPCYFSENEIGTYTNLMSKYNQAGKDINFQMEENLRQKYMSEDMENTHSMRM